MIRKSYRLAALFLAVLFTCLMATTAYAHDVVDMDHKCSVTITMRRGGKPVSGGAMTIYRVGEVIQDNGNYKFAPTGDFSGCGETFADITEGALAGRLRAYASTNGAKSLTQKEIGADGTVTFGDLPVGLYLLVQHKAASGYTAVDPFLVSLPFVEEGRYHYDMTAEPKTEFEPEVKPTEPEPTPPPPPDLPQTGQLWWPVPLLTCGGLLLVSVGFLMNRGKRADEE